MEPGDLSLIYPLSGLTGGFLSPGEGATARPLPAPSPGSERPQTRIHQKEGSQGGGVAGHFGGSAAWGNQRHQLSQAERMSQDAECQTWTTWQYL